MKPMHAHTMHSYTDVAIILAANFYFPFLCGDLWGAWGSSAHLVVRQIGSQVVEQTGDSRARQILIQKICIDVKRGNAAAVMAIMPSLQDWGRVYCSTHRRLMNLHVMYQFTYLFIYRIIITKNG